MVFWTVKKAERQRIDASELWCWRRLLRVPWTARKSNQSILKISPGCSLDVEAETPILWPPDGEISPGCSLDVEAETPILWPPDGES